MGGCGRCSSGTALGGAFFHAPLLAASPRYELTAVVTGDPQRRRDMVQRQLPFGVDVTQMQQQIDVEETRDALKQGVYAYVQSIGLLAQQGMDPSEILARVAEIIRDRQKGDQLEDIVVRAFTPKAPPPELRRPPARPVQPNPGWVAGA